MNTLFKLLLIGLTPIAFAHAASTELETAQEIQCLSKQTLYHYTFFIEYGEVYAQDYNEVEIVNQDGYQNRVVRHRNGAVKLEMFHHETPDMVEFRFYQAAPGGKINGFAALSTYQTGEEDDNGLECEVKL